MNNNRKSLGIIVVLLGLLIIGLIVYLFFFDQPTQEPVIIDEERTPITNTLPASEENNESDVTAGDKPRNFQEYDISEEDTHEINEQDLIKTAQAFAERFGSYSNYSNYSNFGDLKIFMTAKMKTWAENYVSELRDSASGSDEYFGVTSNAISSKVKDYDTNQKAVIVVTAQRQETGASVEEARSYNQDIEVTLLKSDGSWLVDSAYWQ